MRGMKFASAVLVLLAVPAAGQAQTQGQMQWNGVGNSFVATYKQSNNTNISVYGGAAYSARFSINSGSGGLPPHGMNGAFGQAVDIYCVDFLHHANTGTYNAWFTNLSSDPLSRTRSTDLTKYLKAAWLIHQMDIKPLSNQDDRADIHAAIWYMMSNNPPTYSGSPLAVKHGNSFASAGLNWWIGQADQNYNDGSINAAEWNVVTDACVSSGGTAGKGHWASDSCSQEFLTHTVVPEPATFILLGTGLLATLALTGVMRRPDA